MSTANKFVANG